MVITLWIVRIVVALMFFMAGGMKAKSRTKPGMKPGDAGSAMPIQMRLLGVAEVLGGLGLILPVATGIAPVLTIVAAVCLGIVVLGASILHLRQKEKQAAMTLTLLVLAVFIVIGHLVWVPLV